MIFFFLISSRFIRGFLINNNLISFLLLILLTNNHFSIDYWLHILSIDYLNCICNNILIGERKPYIYIIFLFLSIYYTSLISLIVILSIHFRGVFEKIYLSLFKIMCISNQILLHIIFFLSNGVYHAHLVICL
jgi:hypothetical protein